MDQVHTGSEVNLEPSSPPLVSSCPHHSLSSPLHAWLAAVATKTVKVSSDTITTATTKSLHAFAT